MDLAVSSSDFAKAEDIAQAAAGEGLAIDLHRELRHLDTVDWADLYSNSITIDVEGYPIRVLRPEDHLRVICVHWLTDGGLNRERLWDIYYLVDNNRANFDWERFLGTVCKDRKRWLVCTLGLADRYLGLDLFGTPVQEDAKDLPAWFIRCVEKNWISGVKHVPLEVALFRPSELLRQLESRIRPNPISSTIEMNGSFDAKIRLHYRVGSFMKRVVPSLRRIRAITRQRPK